MVVLVLVLGQSSGWGRCDHLAAAHPNSGAGPTCERDACAMRNPPSFRPPRQYGKFLLVTVRQFREWGLVCLS